MREPLRVGSGLAAVALVASFALAAGAPASGARGATSVSASDPASVVEGVSARAAKPAVSLSCRMLPTAQVARALGTSVVFTGTGWTHEQLNVMGRAVLVGGKKIAVVWMACAYAHNPKDPSQIGVSVSYLLEPTAAKASALLKAMCLTMRSVGSNYSATKTGGGACVQGHTGPMQSSNGLLAVKNLVVALFGSQSPAQSTALERAIAHAFATVTFTTSTTIAGQGGNGPVVTVTSTDLNLGDGFVPVSLSCARAKCSGLVRLVNPTPTGTTVIAQASYTLLKSTTQAIKVMVTSEGQSYLAAATRSPVPLTLEVTVAGGATVAVQVAVTIPLSPTSTTSLVTTTTFAG